MFGLVLRGSERFATRESRQKNHEARGEEAVSLFVGDTGLADPLSTMAYERGGEGRVREISRKAPRSASLRRGAGSGSLPASGDLAAEPLDGADAVLRGRVPQSILAGIPFEELWRLHPDEFNAIPMHGKMVRIPRWQLAFGRDSHYTRRTRKALPMPSMLRRLFDWTRSAIDARLNGVLANFYDGAMEHYIGPHRDRTMDLVTGAPIVTISLGEERVFRLRPWKRQGMIDFPAGNGAVFVIPYETNKHWTHEVPHRARDLGRRVSVTLRAYR
jgi:alkylated DNA repair dioxygenase AlkB